MALIKIFQTVDRTILKNISVFSDGRRYVSKVGFIGLGNMGKPMSKNLLKKGFNVTVYDVNSEVSKSLSADGAKVATSLAEVTSDVDYIITMLPNNAIVLDTYIKDDGILSHVKKGTILADSSTVDPQVPITLGPLAAKKGAIFLDAPVSGGIMAAHASTLTFMVGGSKEGLKLINKVLLSMGTNVVHCGDLGAGQVAKICNNMLLGISMVGLSEALNLGIKSGIDPKLLSSVINTSSGRCWSSEVYNPVPGVMENVPSSNDYQGGFQAQLLAKDLSLAKDLADRSCSLTPLGQMALKLFKNIKDSGQGERDFSVIYDFLKNNTIKTS